MAGALEPASSRTLLHSGVADSERRWAGAAILAAPQVSACTLGFTLVGETVASLHLRAGYGPEHQFSKSTLFGILRGGTGEYLVLSWPWWWGRLPVRPSRPSRIVRFCWQSPLSGGASTSISGRALTTFQGRRGIVGGNTWKTSSLVRC